MQLETHTRTPEAFIYPKERATLCRQRKQQHYYCVCRVEKTVSIFEIRPPCFCAVPSTSVSLRKKTDANPLLKTFRITKTPFGCACVGIKYSARTNRAGVAKDTDKDTGLTALETGCMLLCCEETKS